MVTERIRSILGKNRRRQQPAPVPLDRGVIPWLLAVALATSLPHAEHLPLWWSEQDGVDKTRIRTFLRRSIDPAARAMLRQRKVATATGPIRTPPVPAIECTPAGVNRCGLARR